MINEKLRKWRLKHALSQELVASKLGVSQTTYNNWENGRREINVKHYPKVAEMLECAVSELIPATVKATIKDTAITKEPFEVNVTDFLWLMEENIKLLKKRIEVLEEENKALRKESSVS